MPALRGLRQSSLWRERGREGDPETGTCKMKRDYSVQGIVSFTAEGKSNLVDRFLQGWDVELRGLESPRGDNPDLAVTVGRFTPDHQDCIIQDDDYCIRDNYLRCRKDRHSYATWQLQICGLGQSGTKVDIRPNALGKTLIPELVVNPLIWYKLNVKGYPVVHGSAVSRDGKGYVFAGRGASGKSIIALGLVERGFQLLSDHFVILSDDEVLSLAAPFHIMDFNLVPLLRENMNTKHKALFLSRQLSRRLMGRRIATKILPTDILPQALLADRARLRSLFLLLPREELRVERIDREELVKHLVANQKLEFVPFIKYMMEYAYLRPESDVATYWSRYEDNLRQALKCTDDFYKVEVPLRQDERTLEAIAELLAQS